MYSVLKVAHHGSKNSTKEELLKIIQPNISLISAGKGNRYGHPHKRDTGETERYRQCGLQYNQKWGDHIEK